MAAKTSGLGERADDAGCTLGVAVEGLDHLVAGHAGLQLGWLEIGRDEREGVVMRRAGRRARAEIMRQAHPALAAHILVALLADLAFRKAGDRDRNAVGDPVAHAAGRRTFGIEHQQRVALGSCGGIGPRQSRRHVLAHAVRVLLVVAGILGRQPLAILERRRGDREHALRIGALHPADASEHAGQQQTSLYHDVSSVWVTRPSHRQVYSVFPRG